MKPAIVAIVDILGTKGVWSDEKWRNKYFDCIDAVEKSFINGKINFDKAIKGDSILELKFIPFSDTLVIAIINNGVDQNRNEYFFYEIISSFSQFMLGIFQIYSGHDFFIKGAISFGDVEIRDKYFIGPAIDDVAEYFESQEMFGICLTPKASLAMNYAIDWNRKHFNKEVDKFLIKYNTPLKNNIKTELYQVNWANWYYEYEKESEISALSLFSQQLDKRNISSNVLPKINNSIEFLKFVKSQQSNKP
ncbi:MAG: hypothetical protein U0T77_04865 [Chitinophagales bacterium]